MNMAENDTTGVISNRGCIMSHRGYIMNHRGSIRSHLGYIMSQGALQADKWNLRNKCLILYVFYRRKWREMDQDSRESAATTIIHRKTQRNENVKFQKHNKSDWKKRDFHTSHAECPLSIQDRWPWGGWDFIYKE